ncbi:hypothetical protein [Rhizobium laguerreae]|uniref:hypothetical protein n=1 Tax=Rhizobium laguerreae TaxID=1076926 RepID=UPI001FEA2430
MITFRNIITAGVVALTFAATSLTATTPALAHGGGGHGGGGFSRDGGHFGGGAHMGGGNFADRGFGAHHFGGAGHSGGHRDGRFAFHDRNRLFFAMTTITRNSASRNGSTSTAIACWWKSALDDGPPGL